MRSLIFFFILLIPIISIHAGPDEVYINSDVNSGADYNNISDAITDLYTKGLSNDIIYYLEGTFNEQLNFDGYISNSDQYEITFISIDENPNNAEVFYTANKPEDNYVVNINEANNITFRNITFTANTTYYYSRIIVSERPNGNLSFIGNVFNGYLANVNSTNENNLIHIVADNSSKKLENIKFTDNQFLGGHHAIYMDSYNSNNTTGVIISNNSFSANNNSIYLSYLDSPTITNNELSSILHTSIKLENCNNIFLIEDNKVSANENAIIIDGSNGTLSNYGVLKNNFIHSNENGLTITNSNFIQVYFNSINIESSPLVNNYDSYSFSHTANCENLNILNNIFTNRIEGYSYIGNKQGNGISDYNNFHSNGDFIINFNGDEDYSEIEVFMNSSGTNSNSFNSDVTFLSSTNLHLQAATIPLEGINIPSILDDFDGNVRNNPPFMGADEFPLHLNSPLVGNYTIGAGQDFTTIVEAVENLYTRGISGAVYLNLLDGTYNEQIDLDGDIDGSSTINTVTFQSNSGGPSSVEIDYNASSSNDNFVVKIKDSENIKIKNLTLTASNSVYARVVYFDSNSDNIEISGNILNGAVLNINSTVNSNRAIIGGKTINVTSKHSNVTIHNNIFNNGAYGIHFNFLYNNNLENLIISDNTISSLALSIYVRNVNSVQISNNTLSNYIFGGIYGGVVRIKDSDNPIVTANNITLIENTIEAEYALVLENIESGMIISKNKIISPEGGVNIDGLNSFSNSTSFSEIKNNFVSAEGFGMYIENTNYLSINFNTIVVNGFEGNALNSRVLIFSEYGSISYVNIYNNILKNLGDGYGNDGLCAISISDLATHINSDYNNLFSLNGNIGKANGTYWETLEDFQTSSGTDANSFNETVEFINDTTDLHITGYSDLLYGTPLTSVTTDIDGEIRRNPPFIGADEPAEPLSGDYSIGNGGDYLTINEAVSELYSLGVGAAVSFNILDGIYNEQIDLSGNISGISSTNTVTFQSSSGNSTNVTIAHTASNNDDNFVLQLDNVGHIKIKHLTLTALGTDFSTVVKINNKTVNLEFSDNLINRTQAIPSDAYYDAVLLLANDNSNLNNSIFLNNTLDNGFYGLWVNSPEGDSTLNLEISGNTISNCKISMYLREQDSPVVSNNLISGGPSSLSYIYNTLIISNNIFSGLGIAYSNFNPNSRGNIINNIINTGSNGISIGNSSNIDVIFNTVKNFPSDDYSYTTSSMYLYSSNNSNINILNNIFQNMDNGFAYHWENGTNIISDYNNLYSNGSAIAEIVYTSIQSFEEFRTQTGAEANSFNEMVTFISDNNLHIANVTSPLLGLQIADITTDIDGEIRSNPPFIGADEPDFSGVNINITLYLEGPYSSGSNNMNTNLTLETESPYSEDLETVDEIPNITNNEIVDWVLVQLRHETTNAIIESQSAFIRKDGSIVDLDGISPVHFTQPADDYFIAVKHRNHLAVMSNEAVSFGN